MTGKRCSEGTRSKYTCHPIFNDGCSTTSWETYAVILTLCLNVAFACVLLATPADHSIDCILASRNSTESANLRLQQDICVLPDHRCKARCASHNLTAYSILVLFVYHSCVLLSFWMLWRMLIIVICFATCSSLLTG